MIAGKIEGKTKLQETIFSCKKCGVKITHYHDTKIKIKNHLCYKCTIEKENSNGK